jgi:purine-binding chemotaxis protein CheW
MNTSDRILVFTLDDQRYGLHLSGVERVIRMVEITHLPKAPNGLKGVINMQGRILPVVDLRALFSLPEREPELNDRLIVAHAMDRSVAFPADSVAGVVLCPEGAMVSSDSIQPEGPMEGIVVTEDGMVLIYDLGRFLTHEQKSLFAQQISPDGAPELPPPEQEGA